MTDFIDPDGSLTEMREALDVDREPQRAIALALIDIAA